MTQEIRLSPQTIEALANIISGGPGNDATPPIGLYRSGPKIESFMGSCGVQMAVGTSSRYPMLRNALLRAHEGGDTGILTSIIERAADPRDFIGDEQRLDVVLRYLNQFLLHDGFQLHLFGGTVKLYRAGAATAVADALADRLVTINFDTVKRDLDRALANVEHDPEDAVTAASSVVESMCYSIIVELGIAPPPTKDIQSLYKAIRDPLGLAPGREDFPAEIATDIRTVLSGLIATVQGIGSLRTHGGDAHGRYRGYGRIDARIARLAINSAGGVALFILETWQRKYPQKPLVFHNTPS